MVIKGYLLKGALFLIVLAVSIRADLTHRQIERAYYKSYEMEHQKKDYRGAVEAMKPVLKAFPNGYTVNFRMGWLSYLDSEYDYALQYYRKALAIYPASVEVLNCISLIHVARKEWGKVEEVNQRIIKIDHFNQTANYWYAYALKMRRRYSQAEKVCRKMLVVFPTSVKFLQELAEILYLNNKTEEAHSVFLSVIILDPFNEKATKYLKKFSEK